MGETSRPQGAALLDAAGVSASRAAPGSDAVGPSRARLTGPLGPVSFAVGAALRLMGLVCRPTPWRRRREQASFEALCRTPPFTALRGYEELAGPIREALLPFYEDYVSSVSPAWMSVSLELGAFLWALCELLEPRRVVDLGSGWSSFVFRRYQQQARPAPEVWSVDDSPAWLESTRRFLRRQNVSTGNMATWEEFTGRNGGGFDLVLHDLGSIRTRRETLPAALDLAAPGGLVVLDDVHYRRYRRPAQRLLAQRDLEPHVLRAITCDGYGRYAMVVAT